MTDLRVRAVASFDGEILTGTLIDRPDNADVDESYLRLDDGDERFIITNTIEFVDQPVPDGQIRAHMPGTIEHHVATNLMQQVQEATTALIAVTPPGQLQAVAAEVYRRAQLLGTLEATHDLHRDIVNGTWPPPELPVPDATGRRRLILNPITVLTAITLWVACAGQLLTPELLRRRAAFLRDGVEREKLT